MKKKVTAWLLCCCLVANSSMTALAMQPPAEGGTAVNVSQQEAFDQVLDETGSAETSSKDIITDEDGDNAGEEANNSEESTENEEVSGNNSEENSSGDAEEGGEEETGSREEETGEETGSVEEGTKESEEETGSAEEGNKESEEETGSAEEGTKESEEETDSTEEGTEESEEETDSTEDETKESEEETGSAQEGTENSEKGNNPTEESKPAEENVTVPGKDTEKPATPSNATRVEIHKVDPIRYEIQPDNETELKKVDLKGKSKQVYELLDKYLKELEETKELKIKIPLGEVTRFTVDYDDGYDQEVVMENINITDQEWQEAFQEAFDVFYHTYGEYLWFDHLVIMGDVDASYDKEADVVDSIEWIMEYTIGIPTDITIEEITDLLANMREALANGGFVINGGVLTDYTGTASEITIPSGVVEIGSGAFRDCTSIRKVTIPAFVKKIGYESFSGSVN